MEEQKSRHRSAESQPLLKDILKLDVGLSNPVPYLLSFTINTLVAGGLGKSRIMIQISVPSVHLGQIDIAA